MLGTVLLCRFSAPPPLFVCNQPFTAWLRADSAHENAKGEGQPLSAELPATSRGRRGFDREAVKAESEACATRMRALCEQWAACKNAENQLQAAQKRLAEAQRAKKECDAAAKQAERAAWASQRE
jgi:hypothetical protein